MIVPAYYVSVSFDSGVHVAHITRLTDARTVELSGHDADRTLSLIGDDQALHALASLHLPTEAR